MVRTMDEEASIKIFSVYGRRRKSARFEEITMADDHEDEALKIARGALAGGGVPQESILKLAQAYIDARRCAECDSTMLELMEKNDALEEVGDVLLKSAVLNGTGTWADKHGVGEAIKKWEILKSDDTSRAEVKRLSNAENNSITEYYLATCREVGRFAHDAAVFEITIVTVKRILGIPPEKDLLTWAIDHAKADAEAERLKGE